MGVINSGRKKRRTGPGVEEIQFDNDARHEYLTGFHKRKQQRILRSQQLAAKKAREDRIADRKRLREERRQQVEDHVRAVNKLLREAEVAGHAEAGQEDDGAAVSDGGEPEGLESLGLGGGHTGGDFREQAQAHEQAQGQEQEQAQEQEGYDEAQDEYDQEQEEYVEEDRYTTVTVEPVSVSREGLYRPERPEETVPKQGRAEEDGHGESDESAAERQEGIGRQKARRKLKFRYLAKTKQSAGRRHQARKQAGY